MLLRISPAEQINGGDALGVPLEQGKPRVVSHLQTPSSIIKDKFQLSSIKGKPGTVSHSSLKLKFHHQSPLLYTRVIKMPRATEEGGGWLKKGLKVENWGHRTPNET